MKRIHVLVSAYACDPNVGSEPGVGWNWTRQIARFAEAWVVTRANNREAIEAFLAQNPMPNVHWVYFDLPRWARWWKKGRRGIQLYYYLWQAGAYFVAKRLRRQTHFDLIHHVTFVNYWMPSFLSLLPVPFLWGPVGGGDTTPAPFLKTFSLRGRIFERARGFILRLGERDPFVRATARRARVALATTPQTAARLEALGVREVRLLSQVALPQEEIQFLKTIPLPAGETFRFVSIGSLLHLKGFHLGLAAFAQAGREFLNAEYWLIGDGPERKRLEQLADVLGVRARVRFFGALPRKQVFERLAECHALAHPSLHDSGGWAVAEAMAAGRPVICLDWGGPGLQVTEETGFKIFPRTPEQTVRELSQSMLALLGSPGLCAQLGQAAQTRIADEFAWDIRGRQIREFYAKALEPAVIELDDPPSPNRL